ncbi:MAG: 1,4-dihydroxy-2-naphthoate octaprenyltransferase [Elusimicrobia bacterium]|nr:1,4-dihydroxy-2-naphthoate octaprenyltransferase [Elusimicrobiota bacterium]
MRKVLSWLIAVRPKTLAVAAAPVGVGIAMAFGDGVGHVPSAVVAFVGGLLIQIGTNLSNDYFDLKRGADRPGGREARIGGVGTPSLPEAKWAFILAFALAGLCCAYLVARGGWPILVIGLLSILSGLLYTAGPWPLAYLGLGDLFVLVFFGPVAVAGTYYVQSFEWNGAVLLAGLAPGFLSTAILAVNNIRDAETDGLVNKRTLAVRMGRPFVRQEYLLCLLAAMAVPVGIFLLTGVKPRILLPSALIFFFIPTVLDVMASSERRVLDRALSRTAGLLMVYSILFSVLWAI